MGIRTKILVPAILLLAATVGVVAVLTGLSQSAVLEDLMAATTGAALDDLTGRIERLDETIATLKGALSANYLRIARGLSLAISADRSVSSLRHAGARSSWVEVKKSYDSGCGSTT